MRHRVVLLSLALLSLLPATAFASLADEQSQGRTVAAQLQSGAKRCDDLSAEDLDHIGEYVMGRALGSTSVHQAMNDRMTLMLGSRGEGRMHQLMGARYVGCTTAATGSAGTYGAGMMGGGYGAGMMGAAGDGDWGAMMQSGDYRWMMGGNWRAMSRQDWQRLEHQWLGTRAASDHHGMGAWAIAAVTLAGVLAIAALAVLLLRRGPLKPPPAPAANP